MTAAGVAASETRLVTSVLVLSRRSWTTWISPFTVGRDGSGCATSSREGRSEDREPRMRLRDWMSADMLVYRNRYRDPGNSASRRHRMGLDPWHGEEGNKRLMLGTTRCGTVLVPSADGVGR